MDEFNDSGSESTAGSSDMLWESIKVDLDLSRTYQTEQLQSLKGTVVRLSPRKQKVRKHNQRDKYNVKNSSKKRAFKKALEMIKAVTRNLKGSKRALALKEDHNPTTMQFKVLDGISEADAGRDLFAQTSSVKEQQNGSHFKENSVQDQSAQTEEKNLTDQFSQTNLQENSVMHPHIVMVQPLSWGMFVPPGTTCCQSSFLKMCPCSSSYHAVRHQTPTENSVNEVQYSGSKSITSQYSLKEICEELLVQIAAKDKNGSLTKSLSENAQDETNKSRLSNISANQPDLALPGLDKLVDTLQSIHRDLKNQTSSVAPSGDHTPANLPLTPVSPVPTDTASSGVTPDLLQLASKINENIACSSSAFSISKGEPMKVTHMKSQPSVSCKQGAVPMSNFPFSETMGPPVSCVTEASDNRGINQEEMKCAGLSTNILIVSKCNNLHSNMTMTADNSDNSSNGDDIENDLHDESADCSPKPDSENNLPITANGITVSSLTDKVVTSSIRNPGNNSETTVDTNNKTGYISENAFIDETKKTCAKSGNTAELKTDVGNIQANVQSCGGSKVEKPIDVSAAEDDITGKTKSVSDSVNAKEHGTKVLAKVNGVNANNIAEKEVVNSPAFEEMDPTEMETVLLIWRQQEQLHQGPQEPENPAPTSPGFLFKKLKRPRELPPELRNIRVLQPPPMKKTDKSSALQILDEVAKKPATEEDDEDIPETSLPLISPPKKRKLRLKKNPPSPLPVVFQKSKHEDNLNTDSVKGSTQNDAEQTSSVLSSELKDASQTEQAKTARRSDKVKTNVTPGARASQRLKLATATSKEKVNSTTDEKTSIPCPDKKNKNATGSEKKQSKEKISKRENLDDIPASTVTSPKGNGNDSESAEIQDEKWVDVREKGSEGALKINAVHDGKVLHVAKGEKNEKDFKDQIKERSDSMAKKWQKDQSQDETDIDIESISQPSSAAPTLLKDCFQGLLFQNNLKKISDISIHELGKAHDLAINIILNPWRGINARRVTRDFVCPKYDSKSVVRSLWDLRSGASSDDVVKQIISLGWKEFHPIALNALVSLFVLSLDRNVPFVIETAASGEEDETSSIFSDADQYSKKKTSVRIIATKHIFKGECIEGLNGLFLKVSKKDKGKDSLRSWNFPKFVKNRNRVVFGPLAYLKGKEGNFNTEAIVLKNDLVAVRASRQILRGERLIVSFAQLESFVSN